LYNVAERRWNLSTFSKSRDDLLNLGVNEEDVKAAEYMVPFIGALDEAVFSREQACQICLVPTHKHSYEAKIAYAKKEEGRTEEYLLYLNGLSEFLFEDFENKHFIATRDIENYKPSLRGVSRWQICISIAAHEVRHRLQHKEGVRKFTPRSYLRVKDPQLSCVIEFCGYLDKAKEDLFVEEGRSQRYIKYKLNRREFDAKVIEYLVLGSTHGKSPEQIRDELNSIASMVKLERPK
jgi:hypothetical protein